MTRRPAPIFTAYTRGCVHAACGFFAAVLCAALSSCAPQTPAKSDGGFVTDSRGVHIEPGEYARVISLAPNMTEIFMRLRDARENAKSAPPQEREAERLTDSRLIAVSEQCDWPEAVKALPRAGSLLMPDYERIAAMKPGIVLASYEGNPPALADFLKRSGIPLYAARIDSLASLYSTLTNLSRLFFPGESMTWENSLTEKVNKLSGALAGERVFFQIGSTTQAWSFGQETLLHDLLILAGAENLGAKRRGNFPQFDGEAMARLFPTLVILLSGSDHKRDTAFWNKYAPGARVRSLPPSPFERPGPRLIDALLELSAL